MARKKSITLDDLAAIVKREFGATNARMDKGFKEVNWRLLQIENLILKEHERRLKRIEEALAL